MSGQKEPVVIEGADDLVGVATRAGAQRRARRRSCSASPWHRSRRGCDSGYRSSWPCCWWRPSVRAKSSGRSPHGFDRTSWKTGSGSSPSCGRANPSRLLTWTCGVRKLGRAPRNRRFAGRSGFAHPTAHAVDRHRAHRRTAVSGVIALVESIGRGRSVSPETRQAPAQLRPCLRLNGSS